MTFEEVRAHLVTETQRQWATKIIGRTTPCLLGLSYLVDLLEGLPIGRGADARAAVRTYSYGHWKSDESVPQPEFVQIPRSVWDSLIDPLAFGMVPEPGIGS